MQGHERQVKWTVAIVVINAAKVGIARKLATGRTVETVLKTRRNVETAKKLATNVMTIGKEFRSVIVAMNGKREIIGKNVATGSGVRGARSNSTFSVVRIADTGARNGDAQDTGIGIALHHSGSSQIRSGISMKTQKCVTGYST
jgi:hypothetical protein